jgi:hypothetical protein
MPSTSLARYTTAATGARILLAYAGSNSNITGDQALIDQTCLKASVAQCVGCWEGYIEGVLSEFISKIKLQSHTQVWGLITQFEVMVGKKAAAFNTPSWEKTRELLMEITGMDPYTSWVWSPKFANQTDTKDFFKEIMEVRHSFAHGFDTPIHIQSLTVRGVLDPTFVSDAIDCLDFFVRKTDQLLEHELTHRHKCRSGWS